MFLFKKSTLLIFAMLLMLSACGDSNKSGGDGVESKCTIGTSKIGNCKL
jgi:hypothetical protein